DHTPRWPPEITPKTALNLHHVRGRYPQRDGKQLSIMSLLKLTYISHGWHLEMQGAPLFGNRIEAWQYGPVIPEVYRDFRPQGVTVTAPTSTVPACAFDGNDEALLEEVWRIYGTMPAFQLSDLTHVHGGPWHIARETGGNHAQIPDELIKQHYELKRANAIKQAQNV
ncbi:Panacea domain-containing protein, partial [Pseudothioclava nitratireducens]|uniref:Panacea domain-containing protein n=1 Tax=Pseudothioclava nitratireducens TaxID=1928646 RepID=UPI0023DACEEF